MNKKGSFSDVSFIIGLMLFMSISIVLGLYVSSMILSTFMSVGLGGAEYIEFAAKMTAQLAKLEWFIGFGILIFALSSIYSAHKVEVGKGIFIVYIVFSAGLAFAGNFLKDVWTAFSSVDMVSGTIASMQLIPFMMNNIVILSITYTFVMLIALISRPAGQQQLEFFDNNAGQGGFNE